MSTQWALEAATEEDLDYKTIRHTALDFDLFTTSGDQTSQNQLPATPMDRTKLSGSSTGTQLSAGSFVVQECAQSPLSSVGSPQYDRNFMHLGSYIEEPQNLYLSPKTAVMSREPCKGLPLFNIELDGDPNILWFMYYDFIVTKAKAYYQLQPGYLPTEKYPLRVDSEKVVTSDGNTRHPCRVLDCEAHFTRHYDLERHFATRHQGGNTQGNKGLDTKDQGEKEQGENVHMHCDYKKCAHTDRFRKDHCREHYREYHNEDLIKRSQPKNSKSKNSKKKPETIEEFLASRIKRLHLSWWRCSKCVLRVQIDPYGYKCPGCNIPCEPERVRWRENARNSGNNAEATCLASAPGSPELDCASTGCGNCQNAWVPDDNDVNLWVSCPRCRPGVTETFRNC